MNAPERERFQRKADLFDEARRLASADRDAFLERECADDSSLRQEIEALLQHHDAPTGALMESAVDAISAFDAIEHYWSRPTHGRIGRYRLIERIGEGGMGVVYLAEQDHPKRIVALKALRPGLMNSSATRRFEQEAQLLAKLSHPNVAQVFDAGMFDDDGLHRPWFAMEYVRGRPLTRFAAEHGFDRTQRVALMTQVCEAVQHAHASGVVHRDLKPSNILVDDQDRVKVLDFGVARALSRDLDVVTMHTETGQLVGTLPYMSPEQVAGDTDQVDQRSDVYALGVICYELLTGRLPHDIDARNPIESARMIRDVEPRTLSMFSRDFRGDLETIIGKALAKKPALRYASAGELAADLRRHLDDQPIAARRPSAWYQAQKFARRNRALVAAFAVVFVSLVVTSIISVSFGARAAQAWRAEAERAAEARRQAYVANIAATDAALRAFDMPTARRRLAAIDGSDRRHFEWRRLAARLDLSTAVYRHPAVTATDVASLAMNRPPESMIHAVDASPDGSIIASGAADRIVRIWDTLTGEIKRELSGHTGRIQALRFGPDGSVLASASDDGTLRLWSVADWTCTRIIPTVHALMCVDYSKDGELIACGNAEGGVLVWDAATGEERWRADDHDGCVYNIAFDGGGRRVASGSESGSVIVHDVEFGRTLREFYVQGGNVRGVDFHPGGTLLATAATDGAVRLWDLATGSERLALYGTGASAQWVDFSPDGRRVMAASGDSIIRIWDVASARLVAALTGHEWVVRPARYVDGSRIVSGSYDGTIRIWEATIADEPHLIKAHSGMSMGVAISPDGSLVASTSYDETLRLHDASSGREVAAIKFDVALLGVSFSPSGDTIAVAAGDGSISLFNIPIFRPTMKLKGHTGAVFSVVFSPEGRRLASSSADHTARIWDRNTGRTTHVLEGHKHTVPSVAFSRDGERIATASFDNSIRLWDAETGDCLVVGTGHAWYASWVGFTDNDEWLVSTSYDGSIRLWDPMTGAARASIMGDSPLFGAAFSTTGPRLFVGANDERIYIWDLSSRSLVHVLRESPVPVARLAVGPNDDLIAFTGLSVLGLLDAGSINDRIAAGREFDRVVAELRPSISAAIERGATPSAIMDDLAARSEFTRRHRNAAVKVIFETSNHASVSTNHGITKPATPIR